MFTESDFIQVPRAVREPFHPAKMSKPEESKSKNVAEKDIFERNASENKTQTKDEVYLEERIEIPSPIDSGGIFSWRKLWLFAGPGWLSNNFVEYLHI